MNESKDAICDQSVYMDNVYMDNNDYSIDFSAVFAYTKAKQ